MNFRYVIRAAALSTSLLLAGSAFAADGPQGFVETEVNKLVDLLKQPASAAREGQIAKSIDGIIDYDEMIHRDFGQPCPAAQPSCTNHWGELSEPQKKEVTDLLRKLVEKNYKKNIQKTLDYDITYKGAKEAGGDTKVRTEAKSKLKPRDPAVQIDYVVRPSGGGYRIVDIVTEGSSVTKNYYDQFHKMLTTPEQGYGHIVKKLNEKLAKTE